MTARRKPSEIQVGDTFGLWTVVDGAGCSLCQCLCSCGTERAVKSWDLIYETSKNCGCLRRAKVASRNRRHDLSQSNEYSIWSGIRARCGNPNHPSYHKYGARGVKVVDRWNSFLNFLEDMGPRPSEKHSIERVDNNGNYGPDNCIWATIDVQSVNRRNTRFASLNGRTLSLRDWAPVVGIPKSVLYARAHLGWDDEKILTHPYQPRTRKPSLLGQ